MAATARFWPMPGPSPCVPRASLTRARQFGTPRTPPGRGARLHAADDAVAHARSHARAHARRAARAVKEPARRRQLRRGRRQRHLRGDGAARVHVQIGLGSGSGTMQSRVRSG